MGNAVAEGQKTENQSNLQTSDSKSPLGKPFVKNQLRNHANFLCPSIDEVEVQTGVHARVVVGSRENPEVVLAVLGDRAQEAVEVQEVSNSVEAGFGSSSLEEEVVVVSQSWRMDQVDRVGHGPGVLCVRRLETVEVGEMIEGR